MHRYADIDRDPSRRKLLEFGCVVLAGAAALGLVQHLALHRPALARGSFLAGALIFALSFVRPVGRRLYVAWMALGVTLGRVVSPVILLALYVILFVPVGLVFRLRGRDALRRRLRRDAASYWEEHPKIDDPARYLKQF
jgi:hypothetical protein